MSSAISRCRPKDLEGAREKTKDDGNKEQRSEIRWSRVLFEMVAERHETKVKKQTTLTNVRKSTTLTFEFDKRNQRWRPVNGANW